MEIKDLKTILREEVLKLEEKVPYASAFAAMDKRKTISVSEFEKSIRPADPARGVTLSAFTGTHFIEYSTNEISLESIRNTSKELLVRCESAGINRERRLIIPPGEKLDKDFFNQMKEDPESIGIDRILKDAESVKNQIKGLSSKVVNCGVNYTYVQKEELFVNRNKKLYQELYYWNSMYYAVFNDGDRNSQIFNLYGNTGGAEHRFMDKEKMKQVIYDGEKVLYAKRLKPGTYDCIFSPRMAGIFAHEAFGHGTETDMYLKGRAKGKEYMNKQVAAEDIQMYDSPAFPGYSGSYFFDHEGNLSEETQIIKDGILVSGLTDLNSAVRLKYKPTPNSRRENYSHKVYSRMTNTYFGTGEETLPEMIKSIEKGYLLAYPTNGMEDPRGWGIQLEGLFAREIKNGKLTDNYFSPVIITGYVPDLLNSITMKSKELDFFSGTCGKGFKESVPVSAGGPYLKLKARLA